MKYRFGPFLFDAHERRLFQQGAVVPLTPKAADTLLVLLEAGGRLVAKDALLERVWPGTFVEEATLAQNISTLRKALGPMSDGQSYIETIPKRGYRFGATIGIAGDLQARQAPAAIVRPPRRFGFAGTAIAAALLLAIGTLIATTRFGGDAAPSSAHRTLAILPFRNLQPDPAWDFLGSSLADAVTGRLSALPQLVVRPAAYVARYRDRSVDPARVARELGADTILAATYLKEGDHLRVQAELLDVPRGVRIWQETFDLPYDRLMTLQDRVADRIIHGLGIQISREIRRARRAAPAHPLAYEYYLRAVELNDRHEWRPAIPLLTESIALESSNAAAWAELGMAYYGHGAFRNGGAAYVRKGLEAFRKAIELDPALLEARMSLVMYHAETGELDAAMQDVQRILAINANYPLAHWWQSQVFRYAGLLDESLDAMGRAIRLDPHISLGHTPNTYLYAGRFDDFIRGLPSDASARTTFYRGLAYLYKNDHARAMQELDRAYERDPALLHARIGKAMTMALAGDRRGAAALLDALQTDAIVDGEMTYKLAQARAMAGDSDRANALLARAIEQDFFCGPYIDRDPLLANIRETPGYARARTAARERMQAFRQRHLQ